MRIYREGLHGYLVERADGFYRVEANQDGWAVWRLRGIERAHQGCTELRLGQPPFGEISHTFQKKAA